MFTTLGERKAAATGVVLLWTATLALLAGPVRWEFAHSYAHWVAPARETLPAPTDTVALAVLGLAGDSVSTALVQLLFWGIAWVGPAAILVGVWRAESAESVLERFVFGGALYASLMLLLSLVVAVSLWLPFGLLG